MTGFDHNDPFGSDLRKLFDHLEQKQFRSLSEGLGFQEPQRRQIDGDLGVTPPPQFPQRPLSFAEGYAHTQPLLPISDPGLRFQTPLPPLGDVRRAPSGLMPRFLRWVVAHMIDLVGVGVSLIMCLLVSGLVFAPRAHSGMLETMLYWQPVRLLLTLNLLQLGMLLYTVYLLYWVCFKLIAGHTVGTHILQLVSRLNLSSPRR